LAKYIFNNVAFTISDPLVAKLKAAGYKWFKHPSDPNAVVITLPVRYDNIEFSTTEEGFEVNLESALTQLDRYKFYQDNYTDHNSSCTISYSPDEVPSIISWLLQNWDTYVGVSFLYRVNPLMTAADLGHPYLPMTPAKKEEWEAYQASLGPVSFDNKDTNAFLEITDQEDCAGGVCPIR
jgi:ribonucleoside-triphosphate reductase